MITVKELIEKLKEFPDDMEVLNYEYIRVSDVYKDKYEYWEEGLCEEKEYVIIH